MVETTPRPVPLWPPNEMPGGPNAEGLPALTPYLIEGDHTRAAVVVCPGGGYARRAPHESGPVARWLNTLGLHAFVLDYRVAPHRHPVPLGDARRALRFVRHHAREWRVDPQRIGILGFSAGGHLAASVSTHFDDGNPEADDPIEHHSCRPDLALRRLLSNELHVTADTPPTFLWHTAEDAGVPVENSLLYAAALSRHKVPFELHVYPTGKHGLGLAQDHPQVRNWTELCAVWLRSMGYGA